jgi:hypothetical protein
MSHPTSDIILPSSFEKLDWDTVNEWIIFSRRAAKTQFENHIVIFGESQLYNFSFSTSILRSPSLRSSL